MKKGRLDLTVPFFYFKGYDRRDYIVHQDLVFSFFAVPDYGIYSPCLCTLVYG